MTVHARVVADDFPATLNFYTDLLGEPERVVPDVE